MADGREVADAGASVRCRIGGRIGWCLAAALLAVLIFVPPKQAEAMPADPGGPKPTASQPAVSKPATSKPATSKPATSKPATSKPAKPAPQKAKETLGAPTPTLVVRDDFETETKRAAAEQRAKVAAATSATPASAPVVVPGPARGADATQRGSNPVTPVVEDDFETDTKRAAAEQRAKVAAATPATPATAAPAPVVVPGPARGADAAEQARNPVAPVVKDNFETEIKGAAAEQRAKVAAATPATPATAAPAPVVVPGPARGADAAEQARNPVAPVTAPGPARRVVAAQTPASEGELNGWWDWTSAGTVSYVKGAGEATLQLIPPYQVWQGVERTKQFKDDLDQHGFREASKSNFGAGVDQLKAVPAQLLAPIPAWQLYRVQTGRATPEEAWLEGTNASGALAVDLVTSYGVGTAARVPARVVAQEVAEEAGERAVRTGVGSTSSAASRNAAEGERDVVTRHPVTGVEMRDGFPVFDSTHDFTLSNELVGATDYRQMTAATRDLRVTLEENPVLWRQFTAEQQVAIRRGADRIPGYTWHHNEDGTTLQLVERATHGATGHIGGRAITGTTR